LSISESYEDEARKWFTRHLSGELNEATRAEFDTWLHQSGSHKRAYEAVTRLWGDLDWSEVINRDALAAEQRPVLRSRRRIPALGMAGGLIAAGIALGVFVLGKSPAAHHMPSPQPLLAETLYETGVGEVRTFALADGSEVTLAGHSRLAVKQMDRHRIVELREGDGYFKVSRDEQRPFTVETAQLAVTVLGTQFEINTKPDREEVSVTEGSVEVATSDRRQKVQLSVGQRAVVNRDQVETVSFDPSRTANWREGRLSFVNAPLQELVAETNQYYPGGIYLGAKDVSELRVTTSFRTDQAETAISGVARSLGLSVIKTDAGALVLIHSSSRK
jgi:transmembrane sensor